jgi:hypothetical protein
MSNLQQYQSEIVIDNATGEGFMSLSGLARVCQAHKEDVKRSVTKMGSKEAEVLTGAGFRSVTLYPELPASSSVVGKALVNRSKALGYEVKKVHDARYHNVNSYHQVVLESFLGF